MITASAQVRSAPAQNPAYRPTRCHLDRQVPALLLPFALEPSRPYVKFLPWQTSR